MNMPQINFCNEPDEMTDQNAILERHQACEYYLNQIDAYLDRKGYEGLHILTPTSYTKFYTGISNYVTDSFGEIL